MALAALAAAVQADLIAFTFTRDVESAGSQYPVRSRSETVTARYTPHSAAAPTSISSTQGVYNGAIPSFNVTSSEGYVASNVTSSEGYVASASEVRTAVSNGELHDYDRYQAVFGESPTVFDLSARDHGVALDSFTISLLDRTSTALPDTSVLARLDLPYFDATDSRAAMQVASDVGSSPNIEASLVTARSLPAEQETVSGFEPPTILVVLVGVIGSALTGLALTKGKSTRWRSRCMTVHPREVQRIRHRFMRLRSGTWLALFLPLLAFVYFLLFLAR
jgi:hypothetical protein